MNLSRDTGFLAMKTKSEWVRVTRREPCVICEKSTWCTRTTDGTAVRCMRVESEKPVEKGGWIHLMEDPLPPKPPAPPAKRKYNWTKECRAMYEHPRAKAKREEVAEQLGVTVQSLILLRVGVGWDDYGPRREFSSWPSRDAEGRCIGYVRRYTTQKKTNQGGSYLRKGKKYKKPKTRGDKIYNQRKKKR